MLSDYFIGKKDDIKGQHLNCSPQNALSDKIRYDTKVAIIYNNMYRI